MILNICLKDAPTHVHQHACVTKFSLILSYRKLKTTQSSITSWISESRLGKYHTLEHSIAMKTNELHLCILNNMDKPNKSWIEWELDTNSFTLIVFVRFQCKQNNSYLGCLSNWQSYKEVQGDNCHRSQDGTHFRGGSCNVPFPVLRGAFMGLEL